MIYERCYFITFQDDTHVDDKYFQRYSAISFDALVFQGYNEGKTTSNYIGTWLDTIYCHTYRRQLNDHVVTAINSTPGQLFEIISRDLCHRFIFSPQHLADDLFFCSNEKKLWEYYNQSFCWIFTIT